MAEPIRYYFDQHYPGAVGQGLRQRGIDVLTAQEAGRCGVPDPDQLAFATAEGRVMATFDTDFLALKDGKVSVRIQGTAAAATGFDPSWLRNAVEEPLDEADIERQE